jgi:enoyl-CoA hydratase/carnithine racemase
MTKPSDKPPLRLESRDGVGWITLDRPDAMNAINSEIRLSFPQAVKNFDQDPAVRVIVLRGSGERAFCVGADIKEFRKADSLIESRQRIVHGTWIEALDATCKPVIASVHGFCLGGGLELALACDICIASPDAVFALPEVDLGLIPGGGGTQRLPRIIGLARALDLLLTGDRINAVEAHRIGLISRLSASPPTLAEETAQLANRIAAKPPLAAAYAKEAARATTELTLKSGLGLEKNLFTLLTSTEDRLEAAAAFREKRQPHFIGK